MSKEDRFALLNTLSFNDKFFDNENEEYLDSLDVVRILNHYDKTLSEFVKREVEKQDKITDLEAKLAEYEKFMKDNEWNSVEEMQETLNKCEKKYYDIQNQLAEKDEEIEFANKQVLEAENQLEKQASIHYGHLKEVVSKIEQDKISFAVEQLRQLKIDLNARRGEYYTEKGYKKFACSVDIINTIIDNQIKQLKEK